LALPAKLDTGPAAGTPKPCSIRIGHQARWKLEEAGSFCL